MKIILCKDPHIIELLQTIVGSECHVFFSDEGAHTIEIYDIDHPTCWCEGDTPARGPSDAGLRSFINRNYGD